MRKLRVGLDLDGVIYRWSDTACYLLETYWDIDPIGESLNWDWIKDHISPEAWKWLWTDAVTKHGLFRYGSLFKGSREFLQRVEEVCDNVVITSRPPAAVRDTMDWLSYQKVPTTEVHIINNAPKSSILPQCDVYIDDALHNADDLLQNTKAIVILPDRPWNQTYPNDRCIRTFSWEEVEHVLFRMHDDINAQ